MTAVSRRGALPYCGAGVGVGVGVDSESLNVALVACTTNDWNSAGSWRLPVNCCPFTSTVGVPVIAGRSEFGTGPLSARFVASCTQELNCLSSMHCSIVDTSLAPACSTRDLISSLVRPAVPSSR